MTIARKRPQFGSRPGLGRRRLATALLATATAAADCVTPGPGIDEEIENRAVVRVAPYATIEDVIARLEALEPGLQVQVLDQIASRDIFLLEFVPPPDTDDCEISGDYLEPNQPLTLVNPNPAVPDPTRPLRWGELDYSSEAAEGKTGSSYVSRPRMTAVQFEQQYFVTKTGLAGAQTLANGQGILVAVLDSGVDASHPVLQGHVAPGGFNFVTGTADTADVGDGADNDGDLVVDEMTGHGTFVAGLITLIAPEARILPVVVLNSDGAGSSFSIAKGLFHAIDAGADVVNMSLGSTYKSRAIEEAADEAGLLGISIVAAAGNFDRDDPEEFPAMMSGVIGVVSTDHQDLKAGFSNFGADLALAAPGASVPNGPDFDDERSMFGPVPGNRYAAWEGTSVSTALVSGAAALLRSQNPQWPHSEGGAELLRAALADSADDIYSLNPDFADELELGAGRLNIAAAAAQFLAAPPAGDVDNDGVVDLDDLLILLADFGLVHSSADIDADGPVDLDDLLIVLGTFGSTR